MDNPIPRKEVNMSKKSRFVKNSDGTVTDNLFKVMWGPTLPEYMTYSKAEKACKDLSFAGYKDWRLPTVNELFSLVDRKKYSPAIDTEIFPDTKSNWYWTSEVYVGSSDDGWIVYFNYGYVSYYYRNSVLYVRPVRQVV
jgi:hypothetical protein